MLAALVLAHAGAVTTAIGDGETTCATTLNATAGTCCSASASEVGPPFACNTTATCCGACMQHTNCSSWELKVANGTSLCTLRPAQSACNATRGNCTRGALRPAPPAPTPPPGGQTYKFVGTWRGVHNTAADALSPDAKVGDCTCSLISKEWIITAKHCAERLLKHEKVNVKINFHGDSPHVERGVTHCVRSSGGADVDIAICHLTAKVGAFPPVAVNSNVMKTGHKAVEVETIGTMGGLHHPTKKLEYEANGAHLYVKKGGGMKAGDSGGPWVMHANGGSYLVGVLHGGGIAGQTSHIRSFLDTHIEDINWAQP